MKLRVICYVLISGALLSSCAGERHKGESEEPRQVKAAAVRLREIPDEAGGFGSLSFLTKVDISAPQEGRIKKFFSSVRETRSCRASLFCFLKIPRSIWRPSGRRTT